jgi:ferric-dicitrate binding protein FerR (iron transport regulator)
MSAHGWADISPSRRIDVTALRARLAAERVREHGRHAAAQAAHDRPSRADRRQGRAFALPAVLALLVAMLALFGWTAYERQVANPVAGYGHLIPYGAAQLIDLPEVSTS